MCDPLKPDRPLEGGNKHIRNLKCFLWHEDFKAWLDEHNFVYGRTHREHLEEDVWPKFKAFYDEHGHPNAPTSHPDATNATKNAERWAAVNEAFIRSRIRGGAENKRVREGVDRTHKSRADLFTK